jgi:hypothetical protein
MRKGTEKPTVKQSDHGETIESHRSYGMVGISRYTCTPAQNFFGSSILHHSGVTIRIHRCDKHRSLNSDRYHASQQLIEVSLTEAQLGALLSHMNMGDGVPCTIESVGYEAMPFCPEKNERQEIEAEFKQDMRELGTMCDQLRSTLAEMLKAKSVTKFQVKEVLAEVDRVQAKIQNTMPFIAGQFNEALDGMVNEAKADLVAFTGQIVNKFGVEGLRERLTEQTAKQLT